MNKKELYQKQLKGKLNQFPLEFYLDQNKIIPKSYQRGLVWTNDMKISFIESLILNMPTNVVYLQMENVNQHLHYNIIDGYQRISTVQQFFNNQLQLNGLKFLKEIEGLYADDIKKLYSHIESVTFPAFVISETESEEYVKYIFRVVNSHYVQMTIYDYLPALYGNESALINKTEFTNNILDLLKKHIPEIDLNNKIKISEVLDSDEFNWIVKTVNEQFI